MVAPVGAIATAKTGSTGSAQPAYTLVASLVLGCCIFTLATACENPDIAKLKEAGFDVSNIKTQADVQQKVNDIEATRVAIAIARNGERSTPVSQLRAETHFTGAGCIITQYAMGTVTGEGDVRIDSFGKRLEICGGKPASYASDAQRAEAEAAAKAFVMWKASESTVERAMLMAAIENAARVLPALCILNHYRMPPGLNATPPVGVVVRTSGATSRPLEASVKGLDANDKLPKQTHATTASMQNLLRLKLEADGTDEYFKAMLGGGSPMLDIGTTVKVVSEGRVTYKTLFIDFSEVDVLSGERAGKRLYIATGNLATPEIRKK